MRTAADTAQAPACKAVPAKWRFCIIVSVLALLATYWPQALQLLRLDRALLFSGEAWRVLSAHLVHMNSSHLMLNLLALFLLCELLWRDLNWRQGAGLLLFAALGTTGALLAWHPEVAWYAGLSGALHGLWAGCALHGACPEAPGKIGDSLQARWPAHRRICAVALLLVCVKLVFEFYYGPSQRMEQAIGGTVIAVSHAYGAISGMAYLLIIRVIAGLKPAALLRFRLK